MYPLSGVSGVSGVSSASVPSADTPGAPPPPPPPPPPLPPPAARGTTGIVIGVVFLIFAFLVASRLSGPTSALAYHIAVFSVFWGVYQLLPGGFANNFSAPSNLQLKDRYRGTGPMDVAYYTLVIHATVGFGDVYAITWQARAATMAHIVMAFLGAAQLLPLG